MIDTATQSLKSLQDGVATGRYIFVPNVPIFDEHDEYDYRKTLPGGQANPNFGKLVRRYDRSRLEQVAQRNNQRDAQTGSLALIGPGHTIPGSNVPETAQPAPWGVQANYRVAPFGPGGKTGLLVDQYVRKEHYYDYAKTFPRRSIEIYYEGSPHQDLIDWCALLRRSSERDLGLMALNAREHYAARFAPWESNPDRPADSSGRPFAACYSRNDHKLRYSVEANMPDPNVMMPPAAPPAPMGLSPDDMDKADQYMAHYMEKNPWMKQCAAQYSTPAPIGPNSAAPPAPVAPTTPPGMSVPPPLPTPPPPVPTPTDAPVGPVPPLSDDDKARMQREQEAGRYARLEQENLALRQQAAEALSREQAALARYERAECERLVTQLESEHIELDRPAEVADMLARPADQRPARVEHIRKYYRKSITDPTILPSGDVPGDKDDRYMGLTKERFNAVTRYAREHPGMTWPEALKSCPQ